MKIIVLGTRGFPNVQGGVETHCEELFTRLSNLNCDVTVITRTPYIKKENRIKTLNNIKFIHIYAPKLKSLEAIVHTFLGIIYARIKNPDVLHIHAIGPALLVPFAKLLGLNVVITNHGPDYDRQKWGIFAKFILKLGEKFGSIWADKIIVISNVIKKIIETKYKRFDSYLIYNGVNIPEVSNKHNYIDSLLLEPKKYIIAVGRFVEEKGFHDLIIAWKNFNIQGYKLVLVGDADHETEYSKNLKKMAIENKVILTGFIKGEQLKQIFSHAKLFVMTSYHEGLPIALLEAMSYNLDILVSNIPANLEVGLESCDYYNVGNIQELTLKLKQKLENNNLKNFVELIKQKYNWNNIAEQTLKVYEELLNKN